MEEITACLYIDGNDLVEKEIGNKKKKPGNFWSGVLECVRKIISKAHVDVSVGAFKSHPLNVHTFSVRRETEAESAANTGKVLEV